MDADINSAIITAVLVGGLVLATAKWLSSQIEKRTRDTKDKTEHAQKTLTERIDGMREYTDIRNNDMIDRVSAIDKKVTEMLTDLRKRADLTNGNVALIRTEIADLQDDLLTVQDMIPTNAEENNAVEMKKLRDRKRRSKRRDIERDRVAQSERMLKDN